MIDLKLKEILNAIKGSVVKGSEDSIIKYVSTGRMIKKNTLLFDMFTEQGRNMELLKNYEGMVIVTVEPEVFDELNNIAALVKVENLREAYLNFAEYYRSLLSIPIIGITGTCGKTTTKEMVKHILASRYNVCSTTKSDNQGSRNIYYLTSIDRKTEVGVFEMAVSHPNDLIESCRMFKPQIRLLLNIGVYHLEGCVTPENYMKAKARIIEGINEVQGTLILNADDENIRKIDVSQINRVIYFSLEKETDFTADNIVYEAAGMSFTVHHDGKSYSAFIAAHGKHNVYNALAAVAAVYYTGISLEEAIDRLKSFKALEQHLEIHSGENECTVIDDTWSSAPASVISALETASGIAGKKRIAALVGISPQLGQGKYAQIEYSKIGEKVVEKKIDILIVVGEEAKTIGLKAIELGMKKEQVHFRDNADEIYSIIKPLLTRDAVILLKITHRQMVQPAFAELKKKLMSSGI